MNEDEKIAPKPGALPALPAANRGWYALERLPHRDEGFLIQSITYRLFDSVPAKVIAAKKQELEMLEKEMEMKARQAGSAASLGRDDPRAQAGRAPSALRERLLRQFLEDYEDAGHGACFLKIPEVAKIVADNLLHFDGKRYRLLEWCIMPNHVHILIEQFGEHRLQDILDSWKSYTATKANAFLKRKGEFWMRGYRDRYVRDAKHLASVRAYIRMNPVKAGLVKTPESWRWSSAGAGSAGSAASLGRED